MELDILYMDIPAVVIGSAISIVVLVISYIVYRFGIREKSFEQAIEDQKRRSIEEELKQKSEKPKKEKKFKKTWSKKTKEKADSEVSSENIQVIESKDSASDIEIIVPKEVKPMKQKNKPKSSSGHPSPDISAQEKSKKVESLPAAEKATQEKKKIVPEIEKKSEPKVEVPNKVEIQEIAVQPVSVTQVQASPQPAVTAQKKKKREHVEKEAPPMTTSKLLSIIKESELEAEEIQNLIDILLNKQKDSSGWTKKNDTLALTKKNLQEKEKLLDQEHRQHQDVTLKLKDLREEYNTLKVRVTNQEKCSQEKISRQEQEIKTMAARIKQVQDQLVAEKEKSAQVEKEKEKTILASTKTFEEEKAKLLQKISKLETECRSGITKSDYDALKKSQEELKKVHGLVVEQHTQIVSKEKNQSAQLSDAKSQVEKLNSKNKVLSDDLKTIKESLASLELTNKTIEEKFKAEEKHSTDLEAQIKQLSAQTASIAQLKTELNELRSENERLAAQLVATKERVAGDGQEILHQNGDLNRKPEEIPEKLLDEKEKLLQEKEYTIVQLNEDLSKQKAKIPLLSEEIEIQKQKNNELREKNWKAMQALENAEKSADERIKEIEKVSDQKVVQLQEKLSHAQQLSSSKDDSTSELSERLKNVEIELVQKISDYNIEVQKKTVLSSEFNQLNDIHNLDKKNIAELQENLEELKSNLVKRESEMKECLQRICPSVSIDSSLPFEKWLLQFEEQAIEAIKSIQNTESLNNTEDLLKQKEKEYLEMQTHYKQVLSETENTLLELQKGAESQEEKLKHKEDQLNQVKLERDALITEKEAMQSTFQQISQLEELQEKLKLLQTTLESAESDRSHFEQKYDEVHKNCLNLRDQLENKEKLISELQKESSRLDILTKELEDVKSKLEKEKKVNKDFNSQMVKLSSLVKIGEAALKDEQEMVKKLEAQVAELKTAQISTANGTASGTKSSPVKVNEDASDKK